MRASTAGRTRRVLVLGQPGTLIAYLPCGSIAVQLDGETRVDYWHASQVVLVSEAA